MLKDTRNNIIIILAIIISVASSTPTVVSITGDSFGCPTGYAYLSYTDYTLKSVTVCPKISLFKNYRLEGGGSADGPGLDCRSRASDVRSLSKAVCVKTTVTAIQEFVNDGTCPSGWDLATYEEVTQDLTTYCNAVPDPDAARIGLLGYLRSPSQSCGTSEFYSSSLSAALCVQRTIDDVQTPTITEDVCGTGQSLITATEALSNSATYCPLIPASATVRLAGGASMNSACEIIGRNRNSLSYALCDAVNR